MIDVCFHHRRGDGGVNTFIISYDVSAPQDRSKMNEHPSVRGHNDVSHRRCVSEINLNVVDMRALGSGSCQGNYASTALTKILDE